MTPDRPALTAPLLGAIAVVIREDGAALLVRRSKSPDRGLWGFPGGHVELGETAMAAAARELLEETGVVATPTLYLTNVDLVRRDRDGTVLVHYLLAAVLCDYVSGEPVAADDALDAAWVGFADIAGNALQTSDQVQDLMELADRKRRERIA